MTVVVVNQAGGADFTDLQTAIDAAPATLTEIYEIQLEPGDYDGDIVVPARSGESVNNYIKITHTTGNYATGFGLGAHITSSDGGHINTINGNFVVYEGISITNASITGNSDEAFRLLGTELLLQRCFVDAENDIRQQDAVYFGGAGDQSLTMSNCAVRGFSRTAVNMQRRIISSPTTYNLELFNNTFIDNGIQSTNQDDSGGISIDVTRDPSANLPLSAVVANINAYNNIVINTQGFNTRPNADTAIDILALEWRNLSGGNANEELATYNWIGGGNVSGQDDSAQEKFGVADNFANVGLVDTTPVAGENVFVTDVASNDYSIAGENAFTVTQNGISTPTPTDPRVELSDILGRARPAIGTIGAFQFGLGQEEQLDISSVITAMTEPVLIAGSMIAIDSIATLSEIPGPALTSSSAIASEDMAALLSIAEPVTTVSSTIETQDVAATTVMSEPEFITASAMPPDNLDALLLMSEPNITAENITTANDLNVVSTIDSSQITQNLSLIVDALITGTGIDEASATSARSLITETISVLASIDTVNTSANTRIIAAAIGVVVASSEAELARATNIIIDGLAMSLSIDSATLVGADRIIVDGVDVVTLIDESATTSNGTLIADGMLFNLSLSDADLSSAFIITADNLRTATQIGDASLIPANSIAPGQLMFDVALAQAGLVRASILTTNNLSVIALTDDADLSTDTQIDADNITIPTTSDETRTQADSFLLIDNIALETITASINLFDGFFNTPPCRIVVIPRDNRNVRILRC